ARGAQMTKLAFLSVAVASAVAASLGCDGQTSSPGDARSVERDAHAEAAGQASDDGSADGPCVAPGVDEGVCALCQGRWYCSGSAPYEACPDQGEGACTE